MTMSSARTTRPTYSLANAKAQDFKRHNNGFLQRRRGANVPVLEESDPTDGNASLTYSATSSVNSGGSATGESTDSSFADIMRVLDLQDSHELKELLRKEGVSSVSELKNKRLTSGQSVASSLVYSLDADSQLDNTQLLQTIAGQPSEEEGDFGDMMFAPAQPGVIKKKNKSRGVTATATTTTTTTTSTTPQVKQPVRQTRDASPSSSVDTPTKAPPVTPPRHTRKYHVENAEEDDEVWYAKWWMFCFAEARDLMPKR